MHELLKFSSLIFYCTVFSQSWIWPNQRHNMITIVTSANSTSQSTIDNVSSSILSRSLLQHNDTWLVYTVHEMDFSFKSDDLENDEVNFNISTKYFRFTTKFTRERTQFFILLTATFEDSMNAIENSGFGTSSFVIFMVILTNGFQNSAYLLNHFDEGLNEIDEKTY